MLITQFDVVVEYLDAMVHRSIIGRQSITFPTNSGISNTAKQFNSTLSSMFAFSSIDLLLALAQFCHRERDEAGGRSLPDK